ncbi:hypothetical protein GCM10010347_39160 [Streptomyces cirratus]|uniref:Secreted protein n=1 Tax=Streptomyces cirratus TaxID=68187 RepID=A0ABQ3EV67_9ACTN|nr:DUF6344 domain-containing protein [Streptomyces cirratus]GHB65367.1 hypothetical protein GCM10010347_39160 [Streptomyces cirratus]
MALRSTVTSFWTAVLTAVAALLAALGFDVKAPAAVPAALATPAVPSAVRRRPAMMARRTWRAMMRGGSLPPTIKQRIRAEAHGKTPSVRRSTTALAAGGLGGVAGQPTALPAVSGPARQISAVAAGGCGPVAVRQLGLAA